MTGLQKKAFRQAVNELREAEQILLIKSGKPDFGGVAIRNTPAHEAMRLVESARAWIESAFDGA